MADEIARRDPNGIPVNLIKDPTTAEVKGWDGRVGVTGFTAELPSGPISQKTATVNTAGNNVVVTPASGKAVRVSYLSFNADGANTADVTGYLRFGLPEPQDTQRA